MKFYVIFLVACIASSSLAQTITRRVTTTTTEGEDVPEVPPGFALVPLGPEEEENTAAREEVTVTRENSGAQDLGGIRILLSGGAGALDQNLQTVTTRREITEGGGIDGSRILILGGGGQDVSNIRTEEITRRVGARRSPAQVALGVSQVTVQQEVKGGTKGGIDESASAGRGNRVGLPNEEPEPEPYTFAFEAASAGGMSRREESQDANGRVVGFYTILGEDGRERRVDYVADENGFRATVQSNEMGVQSESSANAQYIVSAPSEEQIRASRLYLEQNRIETKTEVKGGRKGGVLIGSLRPPAAVGGRAVVEERVVTTTGQREGPGVIVLSAGQDGGSREEITEVRREQTIGGPGGATLIGVGVGRGPEVRREVTEVRREQAGGAGGSGLILIDSNADDGFSRREGVIEERVVTEERQAGGPGGAILIAGQPAGGSVGERTVEIRTTTTSSGGQRLDQNQILSLLGQLGVQGTRSASSRRIIETVTTEAGSQGGSLDLNTLITLLQQLGLGIQVDGGSGSQGIRIRRVQTVSEAEGGGLGTLQGNRVIETRTTTSGAFGAGGQRLDQNQILSLLGQLGLEGNRGASSQRIIETITTEARSQGGSLDIGTLIALLQRLGLQVQVDSGSGTQGVRTTERVQTISGAQGLTSGGQFVVLQGPTTTATGGRTRVVQTIRRKKIVDGRVVDDVEEVSGNEYRRKA